MEKLRAIRHITLIVTGIILLGITVVAFFLPYTADRSVFNAMTPVDRGWFYEDGTPAKLSSIQFDNKNKAVLHREIESDKLIGADFCFESNNVYFTIYLEDTVIYRYEPKIYAYYGESYGTDYHIVNLPDYIGTKTITLEVQDLSEGALKANFQNPVFQIGASYLIDTLKAKLGKLLLGAFTFVVGLTLFIIGVWSKSANPNKSESISLGLLCMVLSLWVNSNTFCLELLTGNPGMSRILNYGTLLLLPIPGIVFSACITNNKQHAAVLIVFVLVIHNFLLHLVGIPMRSIDYHDTLIWTHSNIGITIILIVVMVIQSAAHKTLWNKRRIPLFVAFLLLLACGALDLVLFYLKHPTDNSHYTRMGLALFAITVGTYEVLEVTTINKRMREADVMRQLAHIDALTNTENRLAFHEYEKYMRSAKNRIFAFVQLDINNLKYVNDHYGHAEGDNHIRAGADAMKNSFGKYGKLFRTGGDEFIAILDITDDADLYQTCENEFLQNVQIYNREENPPLPLTIAYGMATFNTERQNLESVEKTADNNMYRLKQAQKGG